MRPLRWGLEYLGYLGYRGSPEGRAGLGSRLSHWHRGHLEFLGDPEDLEGLEDPAALAVQVPPAVREGHRGGREDPEGREDLNCKERNYSCCEHWVDFTCDKEALQDHLEVA